MRVKKASVATEKIMQTTTKNNAIDTTLPLASIASRQLLLRTRGASVRSVRAARRSCQCSALMRMAGRTGAELPPDDQVDDVLDVGVADQPLGDVAAFIHDLNAVADEEQILQAVGDENDADAARAHCADEVQHSLDFGDGKSCRRLVHDQHRRFERGSAADRDGLALTAGQVFDLELAYRR